VKKMSEVAQQKEGEVPQQKDRFWLYVGITVFVIVTGILLIKQSENEKFAPIKQQVAAELAQMNVRILN
jgi:cytochrome b subunit of formate dehydrogenase